MTATVKKRKKKKSGEGGLSGDFLNQMDCKSDEKWSITTTNQLYYHSYFTLFHPPAHFLKTNEANEKQNLHLKPVRNVPWSHSSHPATDKAITMCKVSVNAVKFVYRLNEWYKQKEPEWRMFCKEKESFKTLFKGWNDQKHLSNLA